MTGVLAFLWFSSWFGTWLRPRSNSRFL